jgi:hypothetical protein
MHQVRRKVMIQETVIFYELEQVFYHSPKYRLVSQEGLCSMEKGSIPA